MLREVVNVETGGRSLGRCEMSGDVESGGKYWRC